MSVISEVLYCSACHVWELCSVQFTNREVSAIEGALIHTRIESCIWDFINSVIWRLSAIQECLLRRVPLIFLLSINRWIQWCICFIDLSLISVRTNAIKECVNFSCSLCIITQCISIWFYGKIKFSENGRF